MTRRLLTVVALAIAFTAFICSDPPSAAPRVRTIGLIEHRGQFYRLEDLMNPEYRAASDDPFVKLFAPPGQFAADPWAGLEIVGPMRGNRDVHEIMEARNRARENVLSKDQMRMILERRGTIPWAGDGPRIED